MGALRQARGSWPKADFLPTPEHPPVLAWLWLACAALVLALALDDWLAAGEAREAAEHRLARVEASSARARVSSAVPAPRRESVLAAHRVALELAHPWRSLLEGVEAGAAVDTRWLRLEHDAARGDLRLTATAPHRDAVLRTMDTLAGTADWTEVMLLRVEEDERAGQVRFELRARFRGGQLQDAR